MLNPNETPTRLALGVRVCQLFDGLNCATVAAIFSFKSDMNLKNRCVSAINFQAYYWEVCYAFGGLHDIMNFVYVLYLFAIIMLKKWIKMNII